ncbi:MAG: hypothetical protein HY515_04845 [Candidatus Aenigmarchaeota archaeon]|nr:hypothetical protein [Candidatus Aenigmarchaeota archaeon]
MQASDSRSKYDLFTYSARLVPKTFKGGRPKLWAVDLFEDEIGSRLCELQGYLSSVAKQRDVRSPEEPAGRSLSVECGVLWKPENDYATLNTTGDPRHIGLLFDAEADSVDKTYLLALYMDEERIIRPGRKPELYPEFEVSLVSDSEEFCAGVANILGQMLPDGIELAKQKRINMSVDGSGEFTVYYNRDPFVGSSVPVVRARFG